METIVKPKTVRIPLSNSQYIDVKRRLNTGEQQDLFAVLTPLVTPGEAVRYDAKEVFTAKVLAYLLGWSLTQDGTPIPMSPDMSETARRATLRSLAPEVFKEIRDAVEAHEDAVAEEVAALKKTDAGTLSPAAL